MFNTADAIYSTDILKLLGVGSHESKLRADFCNYIEPFVAQLYQDERQEIVIKKCDYFENETYPFIRTKSMWVSSEGGVLIIKTPTFFETGCSSFMIEAAFVRLTCNLDFVDILILRDAGNEFIVKRYTKSESLELYILGEVKKWWKTKRLANEKN